VSAVNIHVEGKHRGIISGIHTDINAIKKELEHCTAKPEVLSCTREFQKAWDRKVELKEE
jgi:hypothetical protein